MNALSSILHVLMLMTLLILIGATARAIPDFYTDEDLEAWHKFGLRSFYGPWSVIARKPNGDLVSYADYGARVPSDFRPISEESVDNEDDTSRGIAHADRAERRYPSKYTSGSSDFAGEYGLTPEGLAIFSNGVKIPNAEINRSIDRDDEDNNAITLNSSGDFKELLKAVDGRTINNESKRDTLELIGIVGVISDEGDSSEENSTSAIATSTREQDDQTTVTDRSFNVTS